MNPRLFIFFICLAICAGGNAQLIQNPKMDSLFSQLESKNKGMGTIAIYKNGNLQYTRSIGYSYTDSKMQQKADAETKYRVGSVSKMFTASMIFQLIEEGKLSLSSSLEEYFPQVPNAKKINIGHMLYHRSGLHNFTDRPEYLSWCQKERSKEEIIKFIQNDKSDFEPDSKAAYSNTNYVLLGYILEKITNQSYSQNLAQRICAKIGLNNTYAGGAIDNSKHEALSYQWQGNKWSEEVQTDMSVPGGAGCVVSTAADLCKFIGALFQNKIVSENSLLQMKAVSDSYGMGMVPLNFYGKKAFGHSGGIDGFSSILGYFPKDSLAIAYCSNGKVFQPNDIMIGALSIYYEMNYKIPGFKTISLKPEDLEQYIGIYTSSDLPVQITITKVSGALIAQATGQSAFQLEPIEKNQFKYDQAGVKINFENSRDKFVLVQAGKSFVFSKTKQID